MIIIGVYIFIIIILVICILLWFVFFVIFHFVLNKALKGDGIKLILAAIFAAFAALYLTAYIFFRPYVHFYSKFDHEKWIKTPNKRFEMASDIAKSKLLKNKTKKQVREILGPETCYIRYVKTKKGWTETNIEQKYSDQGDETLFYDTGINRKMKPEDIMVEFSNGKVHEVSDADISDDMWATLAKLECGLEIYRIKK
jgi:hypothetical protein